VKAKSRASLVAGTISGVLLLVSAWLVRRGSDAGPVLGLAVSTALFGRFARAYAKTRKVMPAAVISLLAVAAIALTLATLLQ